ncbi:MAG: hypothetical protein U0470_00745 [Anaerolineae bacterium]
MIVQVPDALGATVESVEVPAEPDAAQPLAKGVRFTLKDYPVRRDPPATITIRHGPRWTRRWASGSCRFHSMVDFIAKRDTTLRYVPIFRRALQARAVRGAAPLSRPRRAPGWAPASSPSSAASFGR